VVSGGAFGAAPGAVTIPVVGRSVTFGVIAPSDGPPVTVVTIALERGEAAALEAAIRAARSAAGED
jgi:hypothetical protein